MTCADCLEAMLDADPAVLRGNGPGDLAGHLRGCSSCRRAANAVLSDTRILAGSVHKTASPIARRVAIAGLAAAALILAVTMTPGTRSEPRPNDRAPVVSIASRTGVSHAVDPAPRVSPSSRKTALVRAGSRARVALPRIHAVPIQAAAFVAVPIRAAADTAATADQPPVAVRPLGGRRAAVFRVAESNVTVVWLY